MRFSILRLLFKLHQSLPSCFLSLCYPSPYIVSFFTSLLSFFLPFSLPSSRPFWLRLPFLFVYFFVLPSLSLCLSSFLPVTLSFLFSLFCSFIPICLLLCRSQSEPNAFNWAPQQTQVTNVHEILSTATTTRTLPHQFTYT